MVLPEVFLESIVVKVVVRPAWRSSVADVASLVLLAAMDEQLVVAVEGLLAEATFGVALETTLVYGPRLVISVVLMLAQLLLRKQVVFVGEYFLVLRAEAAHDLLVRSLDVIVQISPAQTGHIAFRVRAVVAQKK